MLRYLVDTNVVSQATKPRPDEKVMGWLTSTDAHECCLSVVTIGEIQRGIALLEAKGASAKLQGLNRWLTGLQEDFEGRILDVTASVMRSWARLPNRGADLDSLIAATAIAHSLVVVTGNVADFARMGVPLLNPFEVQPPGHTGTVIEKQK